VNAPKRLPTPFRPTDTFSPDMQRQTRILVMQLGAFDPLAEGVAIDRENRVRHYGWDAYKIACA
jgi:hypothetical protein